MFIDEIKIQVAAGDGGDGVVRWLRQKFKPKGGPAGGNGGNGGDVYAEAVADLAYLDHYQHEKKFQAPAGGAGGKNSLSGANGDDLTLYFPMGSIITNTETGESYDLQTTGQRVLLLKGGRGGFGNEHFKSSTNTTPYEWTPGRVGQSAEFHIELQLFADIGLVGFPSAGKSTLLNMLTNAQSKVGAYHFTTLDPHLGVLPGGVIMADLPGLIAGASEGKGLGYKFLRHIRRTRGLAHVISCEQEDPVAAYQAIRNELKTFDPRLLEKSEIIILSKTDLVEPEVVRTQIAKLQKLVDQVVAVSAYESGDVKRLTDTLTAWVAGM